MRRLPAAHVCGFDANRLAAAFFTRAAITRAPGLYTFTFSFRTTAPARSQLAFLRVSRTLRSPGMACRVLTWPSRAITRGHLCSLRRALRLLAGHRGVGCGRRRSHWRWPRAKTSLVLTIRWDFTVATACARRGITNDTFPLDYLLRVLLWYRIRGI